MKKLTAIILIASLILATSLSAYADEYDAGNEAAPAVETAEEALPAEASEEPDMLLEEAVYKKSGAWEYEIVSGNASLRTYNGKPNVTIPSKIDGYPVTTLGEYLFYGRDDIKSVTMPETVTGIDAYAFFECTNLASVTWSPKITAIGDCAFYGCSKLETLDLPAALKTIGEYTFMGMGSLKSLTIPKSVTSIGTLAFADNRKLEELNFNAKNCTLYDETFRKAGIHVMDLTVTVGKGVTKVPDYFLCSLDSENAVGATKLILSSTVKSIGEYAFCNCEDLYEITWPAGLQSIDEYAFAFCSSLKSIVFPRDLEQICEDAFIACTALKNVSFPSGVSSVEYAFGECSSLEKAYFFGKNTEPADFIFEYAPTITVYCYKNSLADNVAKSNGYKTVYLTRDKYFPDVPPDHSYQKAIYWACDAGIAAGYNNGNFGVADDITRGQVVMFLWRLAGKPAPSKTTQTFNDVPTTHNYYKAIQWASEKKITAGYADGNFGVNDNCTRGQIVTFLWRYKKKPEPSSMEQKFKDVPTTHSYFKPIQWASEKNIAAGYSNGTFKPKNTCTRGQCVTFLYRMAK